MGKFIIYPYTEARIKTHAYIHAQLIFGRIIKSVQ